MPGQKSVLRTDLPMGKRQRQQLGAWVKHALNSAGTRYPNKNLTPAKQSMLGGLKKLLRSTTVSLGGFSALVAGVQHVQAQAGQNIFSMPVLRLDMTAILMLAVFGGAMSFALLSSFWMIRERTRIVDENQKLKLSIADLRAINDRNEALVTAPGQRVVVWNGQDERPVVLGELGAGVKVPENDTAFLSFGAWLEADSAQQFEPLLRHLRLEAVGFDTVLRSKRGDVLEVRGTTSGSFALVRFVDLQGEREEHAKLQNRHETLQATFNSLETLLQKLPMPVWLRNAEGKLVWVNGSYAQAIEASSPRETVESDLDLFDPEIRDQIRLTGDEVNFFEGELPVTVAGDRRKLDVFAAKSEQGVAGIAVDKSEVDQVRRMLEEANEGHSRMLDQIATGVAIFDKSRKLAFYNSGFQQLWKLDAAFLESGPSNGELLDAMRDARLLPEHPDWKKWREGQLEVYQALEPVEEWWHLLDGQTVRVVASPRNEGGSTWIFENVTERLALESNYNALIRVQGETLDHLSEAVAVFGSDGKLKLFNPALEELWDFDDVVITEGLHISRVIEAWTASISNESDLQTILGKITGFNDTRDDMHGRMELRNGKTLDYVVVPLPDGQSMLTLIDITASVNLENALRERAEALEASDLLKSRFIQHVSYELRAPLTSISGFGEMLETPEIGSLNEKQTEYLGHINSAASVLRTLVDDILDLASIDAGTMQIEPQEIRFVESVDGALEPLASELKSKGLNVDVKVADSAVTLNADPHRLNQILRNLISNAISFSPDGGAIIVTGEDKGEMFEVTVSDDGPGIEASERMKVFERFEARSAAGGRQGTGLGLSIVRGFTEMHGGTVTIKESASGGACFVCTFARDLEVADQNDNAAALAG